MFGLGFGEVLVILVVALLIFGPDKLPELARTLGKTMAELRRSMDEIKTEFHAPVRDFERSLRAEPNNPNVLPANTTSKPVDESLSKESLSKQDEAVPIPSVVGEAGRTSQEPSRVISSTPESTFGNVANGNIANDPTATEVKKDPSE